MGFKKKLSAVLVIAILLQLSVLAYSQALANEGSSGSYKPNTGFKDIGPDYWAYDAINAMVDSKILSGYPEGTFKPDNLVTRAEFATIMVLALNLPLTAPNTPSFRDIGRNEWEYRYVESARYYLTGFKTPAGDFFNPHDAAVREDMAVALVKARGFDTQSVDENILNTFADKPEISSNLTKYVAAAVYNNVILGHPGEGGQNVFKPQQALTRAEAAALLYKIMKIEKVTYDEVPAAEPPKEDLPPVVNPAPVEDTPGEYSAPVVTGKIEGTKIIINWQAIEDERLQGYKVVISRNNPKPMYPDDGYLYWITDSSRTYAVVDNSTAYNGGDFGKYLTPGAQYYFSVTAVYSDRKIPGNVLILTYPRR